MLEALKLVQSSKTSVIKIMALLVKMEEASPADNSKAGSKGTSNSVFDELEQTLHD